MDQKQQETKTLHTDKLPSEMTIEELLSEASQQNKISQEETILQGTLAVHEDFQWNVHDFPKPKRVEDVEFNWRTGESSTHQSLANHTSKSRSYERNSDDSISELERHLKLDPGKEEFQAYLDREYERIKVQKQYQPIPVVLTPIEQIPVEAEDPIITDPEDNPSKIEHAFAAFVDSAEQEAPALKKKRYLLVNILSVLFVLIILIEGTILVILNVFPNSVAADVVRKQQVAIVTNAQQAWVQFNQWMESLTGEKETIATEDQDSTPDPTNQPASELPVQPQPEQPTVPQPADSAPMADKTALIATQMSQNHNIVKVIANDQLVFVPGKDYGIKDLNQSKPISNNIWTGTTNEDAVYFDAALVGTLIRFDSEWIDFVNGVDREILDLMKKDSEAYRNTTSFSKVGKVKETFLQLEIGEIRQSANGFYVWTKESIQIVEGGKTSTKEYHWIYYLEAVDWQMKVVDYYRY